MKWIMCSIVAVTASALTGCLSSPKQSSLASWNEGAPKAAIVSFVRSVTDESSPDYLPPAERIATFDMDGTLLIEKPMYIVFGFALEQMKARMDADPSLVAQQPFKAIAEKDMDYFHGNMYGPDGLFDVLLYATDGMTDEVYAQALATYLQMPHARFDKAPNELLYVPVLELVDYLVAHDFNVYICSGSDPEFTRLAAAPAVGLPPENIIGTTVLTQWDGKAFVRKHAFVLPLNDREGKPVNIRNKIGRVPVIAVGNSRGDLEMLNYSKTARHSLQLIVNHDDPDREYEYGVDEMKKLCKENQWIEVSMKHDFKAVFAQ